MCTCAHVHMHAGWVPRDVVEVGAGPTAMLACLATWTHSLARSLAHSLARSLAGSLSHLLDLSSRWERGLACMHACHAYIAQVGPGPAAMRMRPSGSRSVLPRSSRTRGGIRTVFLEEEIKLNTAKMAQAWHDEYFETDRADGLDGRLRPPTTARGGVGVGGLDSEVVVRMQASSRRWREHWALSTSFFGIPRVKFYLHTLTFAIYLLLYALVVGVVWPHDYSWLSWTHHMHPQWDTRRGFSAPEVAEMALWFYHLGRLVEEVRAYACPCTGACAHARYAPTPTPTQVELFLAPFSSEAMRRNGPSWRVQGAGYSAGLSWRALVSTYATDTFKLTDLVTLVVMSVCLVVRVLLWFDSSDTRGADGTVYLLAPGAIGFDWVQVQAMMQVIQCCFAISAVLVFFRFLGSLSWWSDAVGEDIAILIAMVCMHACAHA